MKQSEFAMDRLAGAVTERGHVCVGLDTAPEHVPGGGGPEDVLRYNRAVIDATLEVCACYKVQIAYYEALGRAGLEAYSKTLAYIRERGGISVADIKRGDIADTAAQYARAHFYGDFEADIVTLNPYMGMDSIEPWFAEAVKTKKGAFVLLRTSNKGFADFEGRALAGGGLVYDAVGEKLLELADRQRGGAGFGIFGAVAGAEAKSAQEKAEALSIRERYSGLFFLIPGYGAQGGGAQEAAVLLGPEKNAGVVNASRSIIAAWKKRGGGASLNGAALAAREAALEMRDAIRSVK